MQQTGRAKQRRARAKKRSKTPVGGGGRCGVWWGRVEKEAPFLPSSVAKIYGWWWGKRVVLGIGEDVFVLLCVQNKLEGRGSSIAVYVICYKIYTKR